MVRASPHPNRREIAVAELYRDHRAELCLIARHLLRSPELAEDAVQQAFANTIAALAGGIEVEHAGGWLNRCVRNACLDMLKRPRSEPLEAATDLASPASLTETVELNERHRAVTTAVGHLPAHLRSALILADVHGVTYAEIASRTQRSVSSVRQLVFRARQHVREMTASLR